MTQISLCWPNVSKLMPCACQVLDKFSSFTLLYELAYCSIPNHFCIEGIDLHFCGNTVHILTNCRYLNLNCTLIKFEGGECNEWSQLLLFQMVVLCGTS